MAQSPAIVHPSSAAPGKRKFTCIVRRWTTQCRQLPYRNYPSIPMFCRHCSRERVRCHWTDLTAGHTTRSRSGSTRLRTRRHSAVVTPGHCGLGLSGDSRAAGAVRAGRSLLRHLRKGRQSCNTEDGRSSRAFSSSRLLPALTWRPRPKAERVQNRRSRRRSRRCPAGKGQGHCPTQFNGRRPINGRDPGGAAERRQQPRAPDV
jgi:hypothetical protein